VKRKYKVMKKQRQVIFLQMSGCHCTHSFHDEIFNFTGVERTNTEINIQIFDNGKKKQQGGNNIK